MGFIIVKGFEQGWPDDVPTDDVQVERPEPGSYQDYLVLTSAEDRSDRLRMTSTQHGNPSRVRTEAVYAGRFDLGLAPRGQTAPQPNIDRHWLIGIRREIDLAATFDQEFKRLTEAAASIGVILGSEFAAVGRRLTDSVIEAMAIPASLLEPRHGYRAVSSIGRREWWNRRAIDHDKQGGG